MKQLSNHLFLTLFLACMVLHSYGQQCLGKAMVNCPDTVHCSEPFVYSVTLPVDNRFNEVVDPPFESAGLKVVSGPSSTSTSHYIITNGKTQVTNKKTYTYKLLPGSDPVIAIPPYTIKSRDTGHYYSVPLQTIVCTRGNCCQKSENPDSGSNQASQGFTRLLTTLSRTDVSPGDSVLLTIRLLTTHQPLTVSRVSINYPDFCIVRPLYPDSVRTARLDTLGGILCSSFDLDSFWLYPCAPGVLPLPPITYSLQLLQNDETENPVAAFFNEWKNTVDVQLQTRPDTLYVEAVPGVPRLGSSAPKAGRSGVVWAMVRSESMNRTIDLRPSRLALAHKVLRQAAAPDAMVIPFDGRLQPALQAQLLTQCPDTANLPQCGGSALYDACMAAALDTAGHYRHIVVLTDGMENASHLSLNTLAAVLQHEGVSVHIVNINSQRDSVSYQLTDSDTVCLVAQPACQQFESDLKWLARQTGGKYLKLNHVDKLPKVVEWLVRLPQRPLKKQPLPQSPNWVMESLKCRFLRFVPRLNAASFRAVNTASPQGPCR